MAYRISTT